MIGRLWLLYRFEWRKLLARKLPLVAFALVILLALVAPQIGKVVDTAKSLSESSAPTQDRFASGWTALAGSVNTTRIFLTLAVLILAGSAVAEERAQGTLRALMVRPLRRFELLAAKVLTLWSYGAALLIAAVVAAGLGAELSQGLYDVVDPDYPDRLVHAFGDMCAYVYLAIGLSLAPLLALTAMGVMISTLFDHPGYATGVAVAAFFVLTAAAELSDAAKWGLYVTYLKQPFVIVEDFANQYSGTTRKIAPARLLEAAAIPLAWAGACFGLTSLVLARRDVTD